MRRLAALALAGLVVVILVAGQLILPGIAAQRLRDQLARSGRVLDVQVDAFPAIKLLWHHADTVVVRMASYRASPGTLPATLDRAGNVGSLRASAQVFQDGLLTLHDTVGAQNGKLVVVPNVPFGGLATVTAFDDPRITVQGVSASPAPGGFTVRGTATLH